MKGKSRGRAEALPARAEDQPQDAGLRTAWEKAGWPVDLFDSAVKLRFPARFISGWLERGDQGLERAQWVLPQVDELTFGRLQGREATWEDNDRLSDLWANAGETVGDWEITVLREPNAFAQFRLQENVSIPVVAEGSQILACVVWAKRHLFVGGRRLTVHCGQGLRVRRDSRGRGLGNLVRVVSSAATIPPSIGQYHYIRSQNYAAVDFFRHTSPRVLDSSPEREGDVPGIPVTVLQYPARAEPRTRIAEPTGIRPAAPNDIRKCTALINRTHRGQDLFRPYTAEGLELRLDQGYWGPRFSGMEHVFGWQDYFVIEEEGKVIACAGLWDRGRDMREHWRHRETGEEKTISVTALLDFGFAAGREDALARLIGRFIGETYRLGRDFLLAPLEHFPAVATRLKEFRPVPETRGLGWLMWDEESEKLGHPVVMPERPHTDLAYW